MFILEKPACWGKENEFPKCQCSPKLENYFILAAQFKRTQDEKNKKPRIIIKKKADAKVTDSADFQRIQR
uniref:Ferredoxin n=1 Tax=Caenorhabditis tropicalis TaxID=1561998 RepID=A0A1I7T2X3_9PELO